MAIPVAIPIKTPVEAFIDASDGVLQVQVPPETMCDSVIESPAHTFPGPEMAPSMPTVNCIVAAQPEESV